MLLTRSLLVYINILLVSGGSDLNLLSSPAAGQFRAAVYEHELVVPSACTGQVCSREEAIELMEVNLATLEKQIEQAALNGAQIILLPEDGIHGYGHVSRETLR